MPGRSVNRDIHLAVDLGAESGRIIAGQLSGELLSLQEVHRFPNAPRKTEGHLHWDIEVLFEEICKGLTKAGRLFGKDVRTVGVDAWGMDYGLLDGEGNLLKQPFCYRDNRTDKVIDEVFEIIPRYELYKKTGIQIMPLNTVFQLAAELKSPDTLLEKADRLLFIPDLLNYWLCGVSRTEYTIASTSQLMDMRTGDWCVSLLENLSIPSGILPRPILPGTKLGPLKPKIGDTSGLEGVDLIAVAGHDTGSAVAAIPAEGERFAYLSSGTWSLLGIELENALITEKTFEYNITNEGGVSGTIRTLKNITGMWLVQECRRQWEREGESYSYADLTNMASRATPLTALIDPDSIDFIKPEFMPERIWKYCLDRGHNISNDKGRTIRTILESLAMKYRYILEQLEEVSQTTLDPIHIVGGGAQNRLLNQFTADATGKKVLSGPVEATALGNLIMQLVAMGKISGLKEGRELIRNSFPPETFLPAVTDAWDSPYANFCNLVGR
jgi:rhamnulokinase